MSLRKAAHFKHQDEKCFLVDDVLEKIRKATLDLDVELPSLSKLTRRDLMILSSALDGETPERHDL